jgi:hypothetical protein
LGHPLVVRLPANIVFRVNPQALLTFS